MATIKSFTDLSQSKVLAEFLPEESADMCWCLAVKGNPEVVLNNGYNKYGDFEVPCWSLAALLGVLPVMIDYKGSLIRLRIDKGNVGQDEYAIWYDDLDNGLSTSIASEAKNLVDACYEMIIKLHDQKLL